MIFVECDPDKALLRTLGVPRKKINHSGNKGNICNKLAKSKRCKGLVDEDPTSTQPSYIGKLKLLSAENNIKLLYDKKGDNHLIVLCPRLEEWILFAAKEAGVGIDDFGLPNQAKRLHQISTKVENFVNLIKALKGKSQMLKALETMIQN
jgi:hypothetical protein